MSISDPFSTKLNMQIILAFVGLLYTGMPTSYAIPQVKLIPSDMAYFSNEGSLTLICTVDQDVRIALVIFRRDGISYVGIFKPTIPQCNAPKYVGDDTSAYSTYCDQERNFTLIKHGTSADNHRKKWTCTMNSLAGGSCGGANNPCLSQNVSSIIQVPVTTVHLMNGSGQTLSSSVNIVRGQNTGIRCSTAPSGSRPRALFQWYIRQGNQSPVLIVDQSISPTPNPITVPGQPESDLLISYSTWTLTGNASYQDMYIFCQAQDETNTGNYMKSDEVQLNIVYPPVVKLFPNQYVYNVTEGLQNFIFICNIVEAKPLPQANSFSWFHSTSIIQGQTSSSYTLPSVKKSDAGEYRCTARNDYGAGTSDSLYLIVQYGPTVSLEGTIDVEEGSTLSVTCNVSANPPPSVVWTRSGKVISNSSVLVVPNITRLNDGAFICTASNVLYPTGQVPVMKTATDTLIVNVLCTPKILDVSPSYKGYVGQCVLIQFDFYSTTDDNLTVIARHSDSSKLIHRGTIHPIHLDTLPVYSSPAPDFTATLVISITNEDDFGQYYIEVKNSIGSDSKSIKILEQITPEKPINFHVINIQEKQLSVRWLSGYHGGFAQVFVVESSIDNMTWINVSQVSAGNRDRWFSTIVGDLIPGSEYHLRLYAFNIRGRGDFADVQLAIRTLKETACPSSLDICASAGIGVGGAVGIGVGGAVFGFIVAIIAFTIRRRLLGPRNSCFRSKGKTNEEMHPYSNAEMNPETVKPIYEELNKGNAERNVYDKISPLNEGMG